ncbi:MAG: succinylglutamate desuccinylase/aspartoacylase family protein [Chloroflexota bacterium]
MEDIQYIDVHFQEHHVAIPFYEINGRSPGPHIFLSAGMHGGEINGIAVIESFLEWSDKVNLQAKLNGKITVLPIMNPSGFANKQRRVAEDKGDLNRAFGTESPTNFSEQIAHDLTQRIFKHCDFGFDFHDASGSAALLPHARFIKDELNGFTHEMAQLFGTKIIIERTGKPSMMAIALNQNYQTPVLTVEVGGAQRLFPDFVKLALRGIRNFLAAKEMYPGEIIVPDRQFILMDRYGIKQKEAAMVEFSAKLGDRVHAEDILGELYFPTRIERREIRSPMCGFIFSLQQFNQVEAGDTLFSILELDSCHVARTTLDQFREAENLKVTKIRM